VIGVIARVDEVPIVEEFFELFKTPWEFYRPGRRYDVVVATADDIPAVDATLVVIYGSDAKSTDARIGIVVRSRREGISLNYKGILLPIYGYALTFEESGTELPCVAADSGPAGLKVRSAELTILRLGFDLFEEVRLLLSAGQPLEHAHIPTLEIHISMLRDWILGAGIPLIEIPPAPGHHSFAVCLTHDIDFVGIRNHRFDHSMWGFVYRATLGALRNFYRGRLSLARLFRSWLSVASLPFVYAGWAKDFWEPFEWYLEVEKGLPATYFLIPFKRQPGEKVPGPHASRRATAYDVNDLPHWTAVLLQKGCELGVHGIDCWHSAEKGRGELAAVAAVTGKSSIGTRVHWLLRDASTPSVLERAGYVYESTCGYNETIGYRAGTSQVFRPLGAQKLLELPLHIQDGALFFPQRLDLSEPEAEQRCQTLIDNASRFGGVLTLLWHDRSHGPERFWGDFYIKLVQSLKSRDVWFGTGEQVVSWFQKRRGVRFEGLGTADGVRVIPCREEDTALPPLRLRVYQAPMRRDTQPFGETTHVFNDIPWNIDTIVGFDASLQKIYDQPLGMLVREIC